MKYVLEEIPSIVDGIEILTKPKEKNFSSISIDSKFFRGMEFNKNIPVWFDLGAVVTGSLIDRKPRKDAVEMIMLLLENDVPVCIGAPMNLYNFKDEWNGYWQDKGMPEFLTAIRIPNNMKRWYNTNCIGLTDSLIAEVQKYFTRGGKFNQHKHVVMVSPTKDEPTTGYVDIITTSNDPFIM